MDGRGRGGSFDLSFAPNVLRRVPANHSPPAPPRKAHGEDVGCPAPFPLSVRVHSACRLAISLAIVCFANSAVGQPVLGLQINPLTQVSNTSSVLPPGVYYGGDAGLGTNGTIGWTFMLSEPLTLAGLAWYDDNTNGLNYAHEIGIWLYDAGSNRWSYDVTNAPLVLSATVPAGTNAVLNSGFRVVEFESPTNLALGFYIVAGTWYSENPDVVKWVRALFPRDPRIIIGEPVQGAEGWFFGMPDPGVPLFHVPDGCSVDPMGWGVNLGPNLLVIPAPQLTASLSGNQFIVSWPLWATNFALETTGQLPAASWSAVTNPVGSSGGSFFTTNTVSPGAAFYRLRSR